MLCLPTKEENVGIKILLNFGAPFGRYKSPKYCDEANLSAVSPALQDVEIVCASFEAVLVRAKPGDFVYFDPPYVPLSQTAHFTAYHANGFAQREQELLRDICLELTERKVSVMLSNSKTEVIRRLYSKRHFRTDEVQANRAINCNGEKRGKITELIITNYPLQRAAQLRLLESRAPFLVPSG